jgi:AcrR family transcriptional regulator
MTVLCITPLSSIGQHLSRDAMSPRRPDPDVALRLLEVTARLLADEGEPAVSARRVATEAGASTMAVYTHYGSMDELLAAVRREGFRRFGEELERAALSADPVADFMAQGWGYRHFALTEPHLYQVMFQTRLADPRGATEADVEAGVGTFLTMLDRVQRCASAGRWTVPDTFLAGEVVWSMVHGHSMIEMTGYHGNLVRDPAASYEECLLRVALAFGDDPDAARTSLAVARRRAKRAGQLD